MMICTFWADRIQEGESQGRPVFVYFNNDGAGNAVRNASFAKNLCGERYFLISKD
jgi:uncharacterized protein YecE (DUF72 family)